MKRFFPVSENSGAVAKVISILLIVFALLSVLSRITFNLGDIAYFTYPVNSPAINLCGTIGANFCFKVLHVYGEAFWVIPLLCLYYSYRVYYGIHHNYLVSVLGISVVLPFTSLAIYLLYQETPTWSMSYGGVVGATFGKTLLYEFGKGGYSIVLTGLLFFLLYAFDVKGWFNFLRQCEPIPKLDNIKDVLSEQPVVKTESKVSKKEAKKQDVFDVPPSEAKKNEVKTLDESQESKGIFGLGKKGKNKKEELPPIETEEPQVSDGPAAQEQVEAAKPPKQKDGDFVLPTLAILEPASTSAVDSDELLKQRGVQLEEMFKNFKIGVHVIGMERGPSITQFELALDEGIRVNKVTALTDNIAMTLRAPSVRVVAPIPGRSTIGIEIPNIKKEMVNMRSIMESEECMAMSKSMHIPLVLGKDVAGAPLISDLAKMPHCLVAGTTGSGKSVCINTIIISIMFYNLPTQVKLIMIDPKMVEMSGYEGIPHLMRPVITDMNEAAGVLDWACRRMDERYSLLTKFRVRDIATFNQLPRSKVLETLGDEGSIEDIEWPMPYIVIIVDEFSDLMMVGAKEIETYITRLAQKSRAVGIHVILATQRPSVDVITGLIKTNMPSRIAFQVAAKIDSRTILDQNGADKLLGKGDMLFLPPGTSSLTRAQGAWVRDDEIELMTEFWKEQGEPVFVNINEVSRSSSSSSSASFSTPDDDAGGNGDEEIYSKAVTVVLESGRASASFIQRQLKIGYNKASRLIELMEERGIVSPSMGSNKRDILKTIEEWKAESSSDGDATEEENV